MPSRSATRSPQICHEGDTEAEGTEVEVAEVEVIEVTEVEAGATESEVHLSHHSRSTPPAASTSLVCLHLKESFHVCQRHAPALHVGSAVALRPKT